jgi:hypothetical protein
MNDDIETFRKLFDRELLTKLREDKREALAVAIASLETAAWARRWPDVQAARARIHELTGLEIIGPMRRALRERA